MKIKHVIGVSLLAVVCNTISAQAADLLVARFDRPTAGENIPAATMASVVVRTLNGGELQRLNQCMTKLRLSQGDYAQILRFVALPRLRTGEQWYFVRPALNPYCESLYDAKGFRHWLLAGAGNNYQVRHTGVSNQFRVLNTQTNGSYDIASSTCNQAECLNIAMKYSGANYTPFRCTEIRSSAGSGGDSEITIPCRNYVR